MFDPAKLQSLLANFKGAGQQGGAPSTRTLDLVNTGLGAAGAINYLTAKAPTIQRPDLFSSVAPVQNYEADRQQGYNQIAQNSSSAMNNVYSQLGGDWSAYASAALGVNAQSNTAANQINQGIGQQKREDNAKLAQQLSADKEFNFTTQRSFDEATYNQGMQDYQAQREQGTGMMQGALNYQVGKNAADRAFHEKQVLAEQGMTKSMLEYVVPNLSIEGRDQLFSQYKSLQPFMSKQGQEAFNPTPMQSRTPELQVSSSPAIPQQVQKYQEAGPTNGFDGLNNINYSPGKKPLPSLSRPLANDPTGMGDNLFKLQYKPLGSR